MAIISSVPGVEVEVRVNGERAEEYMDSNQKDSDNTAIRYIEAKSGVRFTIHCTISPSCDRQGKDMRAKILIDGKKIRGKILRLEKSEGVTIDVYGATSVENGQRSIAHMVFSELDIDEDSTDISNRMMQKKVMSMGVISIQLHRGLAIKEAPCNRTTTIDKIGKVSEKALKGKALSHQVQLARIPSYQAIISSLTYDRLQAFQPAQQSNTYNFKCDKEDGPFAEFIYQYRSKTALQAEGVIPRTPSPIPLEDRPLEELNQEELRELLRRSREKTAAATAVKTESESEVNASANGSKRAHDRSELEFVEARPVKRQRASGSAPVIIDLSDD
ncbi:hypothetical protein SLS58_002217 [Diplodia intermedia]|uniref:DUF7918 domain-containing protein n=1 Tax=Diplodia intermedia TaxID=856260 RepID=A0ABR3U0D2_9PEZI